MTGATTALCPRSLLFVPGSRPEMVAKVPRFEPDAAVVDLEDAVPTDGKPAARNTTVKALYANDFGGTAVLVRVNPVNSPWFDDDLAAVAAVGSVGVVLPKYQHRAELDRVRDELGPDVPVVVGLETVRGVADCRDLLAGRPDAAYFGAEDYVADIGGRRTDGGLEVLYARSQVCAAAFLNEVAAVDQAVTAIRDDERFRVDAARGRDIGYVGKICVHPRQVELAHEMFTPTTEEIRDARAVLRAAEEGTAESGGRMVDEVHVRAARALLARAPGEGDA